MSARRAFCSCQPPEETAIVDGELAGLAEAAATYDRLSDSDRAAAARIGRAALAPFGSNPSST
jgi:hypothetical protein